MKIGVIGTGYVGLIQSVGLSELGFTVIGIDIDKTKVDMLTKGICPLYEPGLEELLKKNITRNLNFTTQYTQLKECDIIFICVGTPQDENGNPDLKYIYSAIESIKKHLTKKDYKIIVIKSTVPVGTSEKVKEMLLNLNVSFASNPEFLREGNAVKDFFNPDRIVLGIDNENTKNILEKLYSAFTCPKLITDIKTAEMIKYTANAFLATKISFANEIGNICKKLNIDSYEVFKGVGLDHRINPLFFRAGIGFGGSCFSKDILALISKANEKSVNATLLKEVIQINEAQPLKLIELLKKHVPNLNGKKIGVLGLAFKPDTDDIREGRAIPIIKKLIEEGAKVIVYDYKAMGNFKILFPDIEYAQTDVEVLNTEAILIVTEWKELENLDYRGKIVIDGRRIEKAKKEAKIYEGVCW